MKSKNKKKSRRRRRWWERPRVVRRLAIVALTLVLAVAGVWYLALRSEGRPTQYLIEPAPQFSLPTISGEEFVSSEHVGKHNLLLYFNEGMG